MTRLPFASGHALPALQWSSQPIYVLDKDNDLDVPALALQNAADIVKVQPEGPYLVGGHSYGGVVAMEIAMVLESWGHTVGLVLVSARCQLPFHCQQWCRASCVWLGTALVSPPSLLSLSHPAHPPYPAHLNPPLPAHRSWTHPGRSRCGGRSVRRQSPPRKTAWS